MRKYNCGPQAFPEWIRKIFSLRFNQSCKMHDKNYNIRTKLTKEEADNKFLKNMKRQAMGSIFWTIIAYFFYFLVKYTGDRYYKGRH